MSTWPDRRRTGAYRLSILAVALSLLLAVGSSTGRAVAGDDSCPEPNQEPASACVLVPGAPVAGFIHGPDDVDLYRVEASSGGDLSAALSALPGRYGLRLLAADGAPRQETPPDLADRELRAPSLGPGTYFLAVFSNGQDADPDRPYLLQVSLTPPAAVPRGYAPPPASRYALRLSDLGGGYQELARAEQEEGRGLALVFVADDARLIGNPFGRFFLMYSASRVSLILNRVWVQPYGQDEELGRLTETVLAEWSQRFKVEPAVGWGSEQVYSFTQAGGGAFLRGILLHHRNVVTNIQTEGPEHLATWDHISGLMRLAEQRIMAATE